MSEQLRLANFETVIWDLDGTVLRSYEISLEIWTEVLKDIGINLDPQDLRRNYHDTLKGTGRAIIGPDISEEVLDNVLVEFMARDNDYIKDVDQHLFKDAVELSMKSNDLGQRQIIVTNRAHGQDRGNASPRTLIGNSIMRDWIGNIICGDEVDVRKPDARVLGGIQYHPETTLVIGDQRVDAEFAHNIGATALIVGRHPEIFKGITLPGNHLIVESLESIN